MARAIRFGEHGGTDVLSFVEVPDPEPGPGQVRLAVRAAGVNPFDWKVLHGSVPGLPKAFPAGLGNDVAGVVDALGEGVTALAVGDPVLGQSATPSYATSALAAEDRLVAKPDALPWEVAAGLAGAGGVAWKVLERLGVGAGDTLLVHAAAGGVGTFAVQLGVARGARVIGTASEANHDFVRSLGGEPVTYGEGLAERVRGLAPEGVDAAFDTIGGDTLKTSANLLAPEGRLVSIADGDVVDYGGRYCFVRPDAGDLTRLAELAEQGVVSVHVSEAFPLERAADAHRRSEEGRTRGKIVVTVDWPDETAE